MEDSANRSVQDGSLASDEALGKDAVRYEKLALVLEYYRDTFGYTRQYQRLRDQSFLYALCALAAVGLESLAPGQGQGLVIGVVSRFAGGSAVASTAFLSSLLWFALFALVTRYYQSNIVVQRQYKKLHEIEAEMTALYGACGLFDREGRAYLTSYPLYSDWMDALYTWVFPALLTGVVAWCSASEWFGRSDQEWTPRVFGTCIALGIALLTVVYLYSLTCQRQEETAAHAHPAKETE